MAGMLKGFKGLVMPESLSVPASMEVEIYKDRMVSYSLLPLNSTNQKIRWSSADTSIATIDENGIISGVSVGETTITGIVDANGITESLTLTVTVVHVTGVTLNESSIEVIAGESFQLTATVTPSDASNQNVIWSSSNTSVAVVDGNGLVTYVGDGNATITCTTVDGGYTATCGVTCTSFVPVDTCFAYTGSQQSIILEPHSYCIEVWGAQGGSYSSASGGYGGYAAGTINLVEQSTLYVYVGGQPTSITSMNTAGAGGYNGGGCAKTTCYSGTSTYAQPGGGGTDVRYNGTTLYHRFIVAGGGGGSASVDLGVGAAGGGECGCSCYSTYAGKQASAGTNGSFGQGAHGCLGTNYKYHAGGGGGGWYGGGASTCHTDSCSACRYAVGGGSAYTYTSSTCGNHPNKACLGNLPLMTNAVCCPGSGTIPSPSGGTETGHTGCGCVRIRSL